MKNVIVQYENISQSYFTDRNKAKQGFLKLNNIDRHNFMIYMSSHYEYTSKRAITYFKTLHTKQTNKDLRVKLFCAKLEKKRSNLK